MESGPNSGFPSGSREQAVPCYAEPMLERFIDWYKANNLSRYVVAAALAYVGVMATDPFVGPNFPRFVTFAILYFGISFVIQFVLGRKKPAPGSPPANRKDDAPISGVAGRQGDAERQTDGTE
jgi:hypothetical protein